MLKSVAFNTCSNIMSSTMNWQRGKVAVAAAAHHYNRNRYSETNVPKVLNKLDAIMSLQMEFIELGERMASNRRLQLLSIFVQANIIIVIKAYHLVMYMIRVLLHHEPAFLDVPTALLYYGYQIVSETLNLVLTIVAFSLLSQSFHELLRHLNKFNIYAANETLRCRISQFSANLYTNLNNYTVYGLCPLNGTLLTTMLANMITFIVVLIQYSLGDDCSTPATGQSRVGHQ